MIVFCIANLEIVLTRFLNVELHYHKINVSDEMRYAWYQMVESDFLLLQVIYIYTRNALLYWEADFFER